MGSSACLGDVCCDNSRIDIGRSGNDVLDAGGFISFSDDEYFSCSPGVGIALSGEATCYKLPPQSDITYGGG